MLILALLALAEAAASAAPEAAVPHPAPAQPPPAPATPPPGSAPERQVAPVLSVPLAHGAGTLLAMRVGASLAWPAAYDPLAFSAEGTQLRRSYGGPPDFRPNRSLLESDGDPWPINVVGHGLFGSEIWQRARACGSGLPGAALFTAGAAVVWEYGLEAPYKQPSAVDLVLTPILGAVLGEARHRVAAWSGGAGAGAARRVVGAIVDPVGALERRWLGTRC